MVMIPLSSENALKNLPATLLPKDIHAYAFTWSSQNHIIPSNL